jgi:hypothetical protein
MLRFDGNGKNIDPTFGTNGRVNTSFSGENTTPQMILQPDQKILLGGFMKKDDKDVFSLMRFLADGKTDSSFGTNGLVQTAFDNNASAYAIALQGNNILLQIGFDNG